MSHPAPRARVYSVAGEQHTGAWCSLVCQVRSAARVCVGVYGCVWLGLGLQLLGRQASIRVLLGWGCGRW